jgi:hypothetical protein
MVNPNIPFPGGCNFRETDGVLLEADNWKKLVIRVTEYRVMRKLPAGNPWEEIMAQACARVPGRCYESARPKPDKSVPSFKARIFEWLGRKSREQRGSGLDYVSTPEAAARADTCRKCPLRAQVGSGCSSCESSLAALRRMLADGRGITDKKLGGCLKLYEVLPCSTLISEPPVDDKSLPDNCWRKKK